MLAFHSFSLKVPRKDSVEAHLRRLTSASAGAGRARWAFFLQDSAHRKVSPCAQALKRFPALAPYRFEHVEDDAGETRRVPTITNLAPPWSITHPGGRHDAPPVSLLLEAHLVPEVEAVHGPSPAWLR